jgi:guanine nucleotide-binding protein subunit alpha
MISNTAILFLPAQIEGDVLPHDVGDAIRSLWCDPTEKEAVRRSREFQLNYSSAAVCYSNSIERMPASPSYFSTDQDILRSSAKATGITKTNFKVGNLTYRLFDSGDQRGKWRKWIHYFENIAGLLFLANMSEYDQVLIRMRA